MADERQHPVNTQEFVALWHATTEEPLVRKLAELLPRFLGAERGGTELDPTRVAGLARDLVHAFQVAAAKGGSPHAGVQHLEEVLASRSSTAG